MAFIKLFLQRLFPIPYNQLVQLKASFKIRAFKKKHPHTRIFFNQKRKLYSQHNQDYIVYNTFFAGKKDGVFCDVGGNHPLNINNTRYFEEIGWSGFAFEPLPYMKPLWHKHRTAVFFPFGASDSDCEVSFTLVKDSSGWEDMLSFVDHTGEIASTHETEKLTVRVRPLKDVFSENNITKIDYMSIDVEGHEMNVLRGIDFSAVTIDVLTVENNQHPFVCHGDDNIRTLMAQNGFILWGRIHQLDDIYVRKQFFEGDVF